MKTTIILSCLVAGSALVARFHSTTEKTTNNTPFVASEAHITKRLMSMPIPPMRIVIDKSDYELSVYDAKGWFATYPVVFGNSSLADKKMEGDKNTPEGSFHIVNKRIHDKWDRYMGLDYPTAESLAKFQEWKRRGEVPRGATPGAGVGIHGTWPHEDFVIDRYKNWTDGCISLKRADVEDLYSYIPIGTPVVIKK